MPLSGQNPGVNSDRTTQSGGIKVSDSNLNLEVHLSDNLELGTFRAHSESTRAPTITGSARSHSTTSSLRSARTALELQRLDEERRLEKEFLAKKYEILQAQLEQKEDGSVHSHRSRSSAQRTQDWVHNLVVPTTSIATESQPIPVGSQSRTGTIPKVIPVVPESHIATASIGEQSRLPSVNCNFWMERVSSNVQQPIVSSIVQLPHVTETRVVGSGTRYEGAVGGFSPISPVRNVNRLSSNFAFPPAERLTQDFYDLQKRVDNLQQQLTTQRPHHTQQQIQPDQTFGQAMSSAYSVILRVSNNIVDDSCVCTHLCCFRHRTPTVNLRSQLSATSRQTSRTQRASSFLR